MKKINSARTTIYALYYLYLPLALFLINWVKLPIGLPLAVITGVMPLWVCRNLDNHIINIPRRKFLVTIGVLLIWVLLSGVGGYVWQNRWDHFFRNAVFNDLMQRPWPVCEGNDVLCYYIGFWLPPALAAKATGNLDIGWFGQFIYACIGIFLAFRLTIEKVGNLKLRYLLPFIFFSGLDIIGFPLSGAVLDHTLHIELWSELAAWESNTTLLNWVYNQAIPSWVATMLILSYGPRKGVSALTLCFLSISAPFSVVGLFPLAVYYIGAAALRAGSVRSALAEVFAPANIIAVLAILPVIAYMSLNTKTAVHIGFWNLSPAGWIWSFILLIGLEILIFLPFIYRQIARSPEFYILFTTSVASLILIMGTTSDFNSRIELPLNYFMTLQIIIFISRWETVTRIIRFSFLAVSLLAAVTPSLEIARILYMTARKPQMEYRSFQEPTIFQFRLLRHNFVADSVLNSTETPPALTILNYPDPQDSRPGATHIDNR
ncbi:MAG: hypothetical protein K2J15_01235 [Muribaculaceae bacterium]|nr:hypothetical protein [Muribaculaceae bacterium]